MGVSTNAQICYGIKLDEGIEFPWESDYVEDWWAESVNGFETYEQSEVNKTTKTYFKRKQEFLKENPCPVELINYCSDSCPMYILAVSGTTVNANRGYPNQIDPKYFDETVKPEKYNEFIKKFFPELSKEPRDWFLSSYWGQ